MNQNGPVSDDQVSLTNCDREPVHIPGRIQSWGSLLAFDLKDERVCHYSDNLAEHFPQMPAIDFDRKYSDLLGGPEAVHAIRGGLSLPSVSTQRDALGGFSIHGVETEVAVHTVDGIGVLEFESERATASKRQSAVSVTRSMLSTLNHSDGMVAFLDSAVLALRQLTGHDRVMAYRFLDNGDGEVVSEARSPSLSPFLGLRYPASDIPLQVRQIMLRSPFRVIENTESQPAGLVSASQAKPLDMTLAHLRGVSPIHIEYLQNMGVQSTMNTSIIVNGKLWGLFAFHHSRTRQVSSENRCICELFGHFASLQLQQTEKEQHVKRLQRTQSTVSAMKSSSDSLAEVLDVIGEDLANTVNADGMALILPDSTRLFGETPNKDAVGTIANLSDKEVIAIDSLASTQVASEVSSAKSAGVLSLQLDPHTTLQFYRNEVIHEIRWAGQVEKSVTYGPEGPRLTPRASFEEYKELQSGKCARWSQSDILAAREISHGIQSHLFSSAQTESRSHQRQKRYQDLLVAELNHRVRNMLALVRSIARQTSTNSSSMEAYVKSFERRITALSTAHDLVGGSGLQWAFLNELVRSELKPYESLDSRISISGDSIALRADVAPVISLLLHELFSNASRHGALSERGVSLSVEWKEKDGGVSIYWTEVLNEKLEKPASTGFGMALIERAIPHECNGSAEVQFVDSEYRVRFWLPPDAFIRGASENKTPGKSPESPKASPSASLAFRSALVVEDNIVLAMEMEKLLRDLGVRNVDAVSSVSDAMDVLRNSTIDCAVLDINLGDEPSYAVAEWFVSRDIPIVLVSGYDSHFDLPESLKTIPKLVKPVARLDLAAAFANASENG